MFFFQAISIKELDPEYQVSVLKIMHYNDPQNMIQKVLYIIGCSVKNHLNGKFTGRIVFFEFDEEKVTLKLLKEVTTEPVLYLEIVNDNHILVASYNHVIFHSQLEKNIFILAHAFKLIFFL